MGQERTDSFEHVFRAAGDGLTCALTFDDGPNGDDTLRLLDVLLARDIRAVFAVVGDSIQAPGGAEILSRIVDDGHVLCNHSVSHADMDAWDAAAIREDLARNLEIIRAAVGPLAGSPVKVPYWRAPFGNWGQTAAVAANLGMAPLAVTNAIGDWAEQDPEVLVERLRNTVVAGEIVLVHDGGGDRAGTVAAVEVVVDEMLAGGWSFTLPVG